MTHLLHSCASEVSCPDIKEILHSNVCQLCVPLCLSVSAEPYFCSLLVPSPHGPNSPCCAKPRCHISKTKLANAQGRPSNCSESIFPCFSPSILHFQLDSYFRYVKTIEIARKCGCRKAKKSSCPANSYRDLLLR